MKPKPFCELNHFTLPSHHVLQLDVLHCFVFDASWAFRSTRAFRNRSIFSACSALSAVVIARDLAVVLASLLSDEFCGSSFFVMSFLARSRQAGGWLQLAPAISSSIGPNWPITSTRSA